MPELDLLGRVAGDHSAGLRHPPELAHWDPDRVEELQHLDRSRSRADVDGDDLVQPELGAQAREHLLLGLSDAGRQLLWDRFPGLLEAHLLDRGRDALLGGFALAVGELGQVGLDAGLELLVDARDGEEPGRLHSRERVGDLARVGADRDRDTAGAGQVVVRAPLGDMGRRQPGDHLGAALGEVNDLLDALGQRHQVAVGELHALRRAGRARRVDQRQQVVQLDPLDDLGRVEVRVHLLDLFERVVPAVAVDDDHMLDLRQVLASLVEQLQEHRLDDRHLAAGVRADVLDLLGRGGLVDREGNRAQ